MVWKAKEKVEQLSRSPSAWPHGIGIERDFLQNYRQSQVVNVQIEWLREMTVKLIQLLRNSNY
jgi:hypothetical protein